MNNPLISFIVILVSLGFAFFYVKPQYALVQERSADLAVLADASKSSGTIKTLISDTEKNLNSVDPADLARFDIFLPETIDPIRFANTIQHIGTANSILIEGLNVEEPAKGTEGVTTTEQKGVTQGIINTFSVAGRAEQALGGAPSGTVQSAAQKNYVATKASFNFSTTYEKFHLFLNDIEKSLGVINVTSLSIQPVTDAADSKNAKKVGPPTYQFMIKVETYSLR